MNEIAILRHSGGHHGCNSRRAVTGNCSDRICSTNEHTEKEGLRKDLQSQLREYAWIYNSYD